METICSGQETTTSNCDDGSIGYYRSTASGIAVDGNATNETPALMAIDGTLVPWSLTSSHCRGTTFNDESRTISEESNGENGEGSACEFFFFPPLLTFT